MEGAPTTNYELRTTNLLWTPLFIAAYQNRREHKLKQRDWGSRFLTKWLGTPMLVVEYVIKAWAYPKVRFWPYLSTINCQWLMSCDQMLLDCLPAICVDGRTTTEREGWRVDWMFFLPILAAEVSSTTRCYGLGTSWWARSEVNLSYILKYNMWQCRNLVASSYTIRNSSQYEWHSIFFKSETKPIQISKISRNE